MAFSPDRALLTRVQAGEGEALNALVTELQTYCKRVASPVKYPRSIAFAPFLPKTESGKILRAELRDAL